MVQQNEELMQFFKAFVDIDRLKIVGVLAQGHTSSIQKLSDRVEMSASEVLHHLKQLRETGLVIRKSREDGLVVFELDTKLLEEMAKRQFARAKELDESAIDQRKIPPDFTEEERKVLINYTLPNGEIKPIPFQKKNELILIRYVRHHVLQALEFGKQYTEKEINALIKPFHPDAAFFRRNFVDTGYLNRLANGSAYWLAEKEEARHD